MIELICARGVYGSAALINLVAMPEIEQKTTFDRKALVEDVHNSKPPSQPGMIETSVLREAYRQFDARASRFRM